MEPSNLGHRASRCYQQPDAQQFLKPARLPIPSLRRLRQAKRLRQRTASAQDRLLPAVLPQLLPSEAEARASAVLLGALIAFAFAAAIGLLQVAVLGLARAVAP